MPFKVDFRADGTPVRWTADPPADGRDGTPVGRTADPSTGEADATGDAGAAPPGATATADPDYRPALYAAARDDRTRYLDWLADALDPDPKVAGVEWTRRRPDLRADDPSPMLCVRAERTSEVRQVAREIRDRAHDAHPPGVLSLYDVDLDPQFRYCLDTGRDPTPARPLRTCSLSLPDRAVAGGDLGSLTVDGEPAGDTERAARRRVERLLDEDDPDVLVVSSGELVPLLAEAGIDLGRRSETGTDLGRRADASAGRGDANVGGSDASAGRGDANAGGGDASAGRGDAPGGDADGPGYRKLAGESTYVSYGRVGYSPARYDVPGRVVVDRSNSFLLEESGMAGLEYFVERAGKPLQEVAHDSIGGVLTAVEVREARSRNVPAPWQKRQTEGWKSVDELHAADRGGFTFQPEVGVHEDVHELDFASLYPNVIREYGVSPDTVRCDCHDRDDVPELGYSVCDRGGFLGDVLGPLLDDRAAWKERLRAADERGTTGDQSATDPGLDPRERARLEAKVEAVKWVLVSCFGYQGYRHAKFGRIEVHEAINAYAREIMLTAKEAFERAGWRVVHGIVDSLWVTPDPERDPSSGAGGGPRPVREVAREVSDEVGIALEHEGQFDWVAFPPRKRASGAALMRYYGRWADESTGTDEVTDAEAVDEATDADEGAGDADRYKFRGIEARQRSTPSFVADAQRDLVAAFDRERDPAAVCDRLAAHLATLRRGAVDPGDLVVRKRVSKRAGEYDRATRTKAALERAAALGLERHPGQTVEYVVVDDDLSGPERVRLAFEVREGGDPARRRGRDADGTVGYDAEFYADLLVRACESVVAPLGWDEGRVRRYLRGDRDATLFSFGP
ncbi:MAG: type B DNA-directed DNA polymerase [Haloarculaceae archaeon]